MECKDLVSLLERNGLARIDASALVAFMDGKQRTTAEIEREAGLRQPEVSLAMKSLIGRGWFKQEHIKKESGKGRPYIVYHPAKKFGDICVDIAAARGTEIAGMMADLNTLRAVA